MKVTTGWLATAAVSGGYALATQMVWSPADLHKAHMVGFHLDDGSRAGATATSTPLDKQRPLRSMPRSPSGRAWHCLKLYAEKVLAPLKVNRDIIKREP